MEKNSPEILFREGDDAMASENWGTAEEKFEEAKAAILAERQTATPEKAAELDWLLISLEGDGSPWRPGRIAMAKDFRQRIAGLGSWLKQGRLPQGASGEKRREVFGRARYELARSSINQPMQIAADEAVASIMKSEKWNDRKDFFRVSEIVFAFIAGLFESVDKKNEEELIQFSLSLPGDDSFEAERRASRSDNPMAVQDRIMKRYQRLRETPFGRSLIQKHAGVFESLGAKILRCLNIRKSDENWSAIAAFIKSRGVIPPDIDE